MKTIHQIKVDAIVDARTRGASEPEVWRQATLRGWDIAAIQDGLEKARREKARGIAAREDRLSRTH